MSKADLFIRKMIRTYGQTVQHKKRVKNVEGEEVFYSYVVQEPKRGQFSQITSTDQVFDRWGFRIEADMIGTFLPGTEVNEGDLLYVNDAWYEVLDRTVRKTGSKEDFVEVLLRRRSS